MGAPGVAEGAMGVWQEAADVRGEQQRCDGRADVPR